MSKYAPRKWRRSNRPQIQLLALKQIPKLLNATYRPVRAPTYGREPYKASAAPFRLCVLPGRNVLSHLKHVYAVCYCIGHNSCLRLTIYIHILRHPPRPLFLLRFTRQVARTTSRSYLPSPIQVVLSVFLTYLVVYIWHQPSYTRAYLLDLTRLASPSERQHRPHQRFHSCSKFAYLPCARSPAV
jgi:hypothetical protein